MSTQQIIDYINSPYFKVPTNPMLYDPSKFCSFSVQGENIVNGLINVTPTSDDLFNFILPLKDQQRIAQDAFKFRGDEWCEREAEKKLKIESDPNNMA